MCGIAGKVSRRPFDRGVVARMGDALTHRGPDDGGAWFGDGVGLASRRLAVIDLSERSRQPMAGAAGRLRLVFNGEIYNYQQLRAEMERDGERFESDGDAEVLLRAYAREGAACLRRLRGMFAFAVWDTVERSLFIARDRLGKKPLFYAQLADGIVFGSEIVALAQDPDVPFTPDLRAIDRYLTLGYIPSPLSGFEAVRKLPPGHWLEWRDGQVRTTRYWDLRFTPKRTEPEAVLREELVSRLEESVRLRLISDVPLGALLSGGVDSSAVVALMRRQTSGAIRTFSIGFEQPDYDELQYAREVASHFGTEHQELIVRPESENWLDRIVGHYGEPYADSSAIPSLALCRMARQSVTVALSGDGGDESFLGYDRYRALQYATRQHAWPMWTRRAGAAAASRLRVVHTKGLAARVRRFGETLPLAPLDRYTRWITFATPALKAELYTARLAAAAGPDSMDAYHDAFARSDADTDVERAVDADVQIYLPDDLLVKMDIASMASSLEVRSPLLDHEVVEFAASLPLGLKLKGGTGKYLLKQVLRDQVPPTVLTRRKMGFGVPIDAWLRGHLRETSRALLLDSRAVSRGYFEKAPVERMLDEHAAGRANHQQVLWALMLLEVWHQRFIDGRARAPQPLTTGVAP